MSTRKRAPQDAPPTRLAEAPGHPVVGRLAGWLAGSGPLVDYEDNTSGPLPARSLTPLDEATVVELAQQGQEVALVFERGDPGRPLILGLVQPVSPTPNLDLILSPAPAPDNAPDEQDPTEVEARVDGQRVVIEGKDEVVLRCGLASITLRRNGRVVIRGTYLVSRSEGVNRIKGGSVQIN